MHGVQAFDPPTEYVLAKQFAQEFAADAQVPGPQTVHWLLPAFELMRPLIASQVPQSSDPPELYFPTAH